MENHWSMRCCYGEEFPGREPLQRRCYAVTPCLDGLMRTYLFVGPRISLSGCVDAYICISQQMHEQEFIENNFL